MFMHIHFQSNQTLTETLTFFGNSRPIDLYLVKDRSRCVTSFQAREQSTLTAIEGVMNF
jgi:hypothetical protein